MIKVLGGTFHMGSSDSATTEDENLLHLVTVDHIWAGEHEVTWDLFELFLAKNNTVFDSLPEKESNKIDAVTRLAV